ncbi:MAG: serine/threonine protein kinase [Mycoplasmoidaceae bacterium]|nr:serine/threonine protein kinase [Mycoplasmoidaceae bacterium]
MFVTKDDDIVLIMGYIDGVTLRTYLNRHGALTPKVALNIFKKMLNGIKQLHRYKQQIIHRDLKPENVMVSHDLSKVVIVDFGISSVVKADINEVMTNEPGLYGTSSYILPDLLPEYGKKEGNKHITVQSDFFSLGVILYEMIMGTLPFEQIKDDNGNLNKTATIKLPLRYDMINISANPTIPTSLENIIFRCIASKEIDKKYRYDDIDQIIDDVNRCLPLLDKKADTTPLLKPVNQRFYQSNPLIDITDTRQNQK